jgi:hypothetical protein
MKLEQVNLSKINKLLRTTPDPRHGKERNSEAIHMAAGIATSLRVAPRHDGEGVNGPTLRISI